MSEKTIVQNPLGVEKEGKLLLQFAIPGIISMVVNSLYNMVDQIFIGQGVGMLGNGATNIIAPIATIAIALSSLFCDGLSTYFSLNLGQGKPENASKAVGTTIIASSVTGVILSAGIYIFLRPLCLVFGSSLDILPYAMDYGRIIALGFPFVLVSITINGVVRADGSPKFSMVSMMVGTLINFFLDPLFIFVFHMGVKGAALATIISQLIAALINIAYLFRFKNIKLRKESFIFNWHLLKTILTLGVASLLNTLASTIIGMVSNNLYRHYGALSIYGENIPLTVFGLCMKISMLFFSITMGISSGARPILGFNYGAKKIDRVKKTFKLSLIWSTVVMVAAWLLYMFFPLPLIRLYGSESGMYEEFAVKCFRIYLLLSFLGGIQPCVGSLFQAIGKPGLASVISLGKQVIFYVPFLLVLPLFMGIDGLLWAGPVSEGLTCILALILMRHVTKNLGKKKIELEE